MSEWLESVPEETESRPERRSEFRLNRALRARAGELALYIVNLSASGFRATFQGPAPADTFTLRVDLPGEPLDVQARQVWSQEPDYADMTDAGFTFVDLPAAARERLLAFLRADVASRRSHDAPDPDAL